MSYPKVGIGIITTQNRELHPNLLNLVSQPTQFYVYTDYERRGPAHGRNECLKALYDGGCDYIFLFDDDVYPIQRGWESLYIDMCKNTNIHCCGYPDHRSFAPVATTDSVEYFQWNTGCFKFISRKFIDEVGYFNAEYGTYGFEDIAYLYRARLSGLGGTGEGDPSPLGYRDFIWAADISGNPEGFDPFANTAAEDKTAFINENRVVFDRDVASRQVYFPYAPKH